MTLANSLERHCPLFGAANEHVFLPGVLAVRMTLLLELFESDAVSANHIFEVFHVIDCPHKRLDSLCANGTKPLLHFLVGWACEFQFSEQKIRFLERSALELGLCSLQNRLVGIGSMREGR